MKNKNKKGSIGQTIFYVSLTILLVFGLTKLGVFDDIVSMVMGWFS